MISFVSVAYFDILNTKAYPKGYSQNTHKVMIHGRSIVVVSTCSRIHLGICYLTGEHAERSVQKFER